MAEWAALRLLAIEAEEVAHCRDYIRRRPEWTSSLCLLAHRAGLQAQLSLALGPTWNPAHVTLVGTTLSLYLSRQRVLPLQQQQQ
jgi:hypothetical protein